MANERKNPRSAPAGLALRLAEEERKAKEEAEQKRLAREDAARKEVEKHQTDIASDTIVSDTAVLVAPVYSSEVHHSSISPVLKESASVVPVIVEPNNVQVDPVVPAPIPTGKSDMSVSVPIRKKLNIQIDGDLIKRAQHRAIDLGTHDYLVWERAMRFYLEHHSEEP